MLAAERGMNAGGVMSVRVEFHFGRADGIESALLESSISFRDWYWHLASDGTSGFCPDLLPTIDAISQNGRAALLPRSVDEAAVLDKVVDIFVADFCNWGSGAGMFPPVNESMLSIRHYAALESRVEAFGSKQLVNFWQWMLRGRPVARDACTFPYQPSEPEFRVSFALAAEVSAIGAAAQRFRSTQIGRLTAWDDAVLHWVVDAMGHAVQRGVGLLVTAA